MKHQITCNSCYRTIRFDDQDFKPGIVFVECPYCKSKIRLEFESEKNVSSVNNSENSEKLYPSRFPVTTCDLQVPYDIIGPVFFQVSNRGIFTSALSKLIASYDEKIEDLKNKKLVTDGSFDWGGLFGEWYAGQSEFGKAFYVSVEELKKMAVTMGGDAIIGLRQDIDIDTNGFQFFYLQVYGTVVKIK